MKKLLLIGLLLSGPVFAKESINFKIIYLGDGVYEYLDKKTNCHYFVYSEESKILKYGKGGISIRYGKNGKPMCGN